MNKYIITFIGRDSVGPKNLQMTLTGHYLKKRVQIWFKEQIIGKFCIECHSTGPKRHWWILLFLWMLTVELVTKSKIDIFITLWIKLDNKHCGFSIVNDSRNINKKIVRRILQCVRKK